MSDKQNLTQIIRKDARGCFVESLWDAFSYGKAHLVFASYDMNRPAGQRQTNNIHIYLSMTELLELCRKAESGELRYLLQAHKKNGSKEAIYQSLGGTSAEKLAKIGRSRPWNEFIKDSSSFWQAVNQDFLLWLTVDRGRRMRKV